MTEALAKFDAASASDDLQNLAAELAHDVDALIAHVELAMPEVPFGRKEARALVRHVTREREMDQMASTPSGVGVIDSRIDRALYEEVARLEAENRLLEEIACKDPNHDYTIGRSKEAISTEDARARIESNVERLLKIKGAIGARIKADAGIGGVSVSVNIGSVVEDALNNIKALEQEVDAKIVDTQQA